MRVLSLVLSRLFGLYGFGERTLRRRAGPIHIGYGLDQRRRAGPIHIGYGLDQRRFG